MFISQGESRQHEDEGMKISRRETLSGIGLAGAATALNPAAGAPANTKWLPAEHIYSLDDQP